MIQKLSLRRKAWALSICKPDDLEGNWYAQSSFWSVTRTASEYSVICETSFIPAGMKAEHSWVAYEVEGPIAFDVIGVLSGLSSVMAQERISILAVSTYDTDYILVKHDKRDVAENAWHGAGYGIL